MHSNVRILVTGGSGFVAGSIIKQAPAGVHLDVLTRGEPLYERPGIAWHRTDAGAASVGTLVEKLRPATVIHTAAVADIDFCEAHPDEAIRANTDLTRAIARACAEQACRLVFLSTDTVFDGTRGHYSESDAPRAVNVYAQTKIDAEGAVQSQLDDYVVARVALVMGLPVLGKGNSFLSRMIATLGKGNTVTVPNNEIRTPIDVITLGRVLLELATHDFRGIMHLAGNDRINRYEMTKRIVAQLGYSPDRVIAHDPSSIPGRAPRPLDVSLDNTLARRTLATPFGGLDEGIERVLRFAEGAP